MFLAQIEPGTYLEFTRAVSFRDAGALVEQGLLNEAGAISGRAQAATRSLSPGDFNRIVELGLSSLSDILRRTEPRTTSNALREEPSSFIHEARRLRIESYTNRAVRDRLFRQRVLTAYGERCAITGVGLINGGGSAEAEAEHIPGGA